MSNSPSGRVISPMRKLEMHDMMPMIPPDFLPSQSRTAAATSSRENMNDKTPTIRTIGLRSHPISGTDVMAAPPMSIVELPMKPSTPKIMNKMDAIVMEKGLDFDA